MAARGQKPKPTQLKLVTGNPGGRPLPKKEAVIPNAEPLPPPFLTEDALEEWNRVCKLLYDAGLMTEADRGALSAYCQAYGRWAEAEKALALMAKKDNLTRALMVKTSNGNAIQNPLVGTANKAMADMVRYATEFGMTPSARSRVDANPPGSPDSLPAQSYFTGNKNG